MLHTTGALQTTPTDSLDAHANLLPFQHLVENLLHRAATQIATLPKTHPLTAHANKAVKTYVKSHRSPLHELLHAYKIVPSDFKDIRPIHTSPKHPPRYATRISANRNAALEEIMKLTQETRVYLDGSCIDGQIGAAAMMFKHGEEVCTLRKHIGDEYHHTVYEAEVIGLTLAAKLIAREPSVETTMIGANNQAAI